jgi:hypothetical protein
MSDDQRSTSVPDGVTNDPDDESDLPRERLDDDFDIASARDQYREQHRPGHAAHDPSEASEVVDGS